MKDGVFELSFVARPARSARLSKLGVAHLTRLYPIDHGISAAMQADFLDWLHALVTVP